MPKQVINVAADDALTQIYRLANDEGEEVIAARLAERLNLKPPSMAGMLSRLKRDKLVKVDAKKRVTLTTEGFRRAENMVRRHRLAECLLVNILGLNWWQAYEEAHLVEHSISDITEPLIVERLGNPTTSPFGAIIPGSENASSMSRKRLSDQIDGTTQTIDRVFEEDEELLRFFESKEPKPGATVRITERAAYRGTITITVDGKEIVLGLQAGSRIWVR
ncbi:MAG TPA: metal-dependent transcriptional regulator [Dehalococcoidia bacterium]|nr:metal-dependent transcriptional regulator [Dehalococcoidia bacterium]